MGLWGAKGGKGNTGQGSPQIINARGMHAAPAVKPAEQFDQCASCWPAKQHNSQATNEAW